MPQCVSSFSDGEDDDAGADDVDDADDDDVDDADDDGDDAGDDVGVLACVFFFVATIGARFVSHTTRRRRTVPCSWHIRGSVDSCATMRASAPSTMAATPLSTTGTNGVVGCGNGIGPITSFPFLTAR